ncbi:MAG: response regulator transcription factor [Flavobacteriales bacterium]|nr:response regulator transcription factor [Flavobacteriales bacterium]MBK9289179.1 response regulator transcription factor [Flavobacteriales bacterium]MBL0034159.1 response regulator transcription factor [Flavobacteriales bacterium]
MAERTLLIVEDEPHMAELLQNRFQLEGFVVHHAADGLEALAQFTAVRPDLCILDVMLPKMDGFQVAREMRKIAPLAAFIFLTARNTLPDKQAGFNSGCDDYLTKPFLFEELLLRVNAVLYRTQGPKVHASGSLVFPTFTLHVRERTLEMPGRTITLTAKENRILYILLSNAGNMVERRFLVEQVWGSMNDYHSRSLDVYLTRLRKYVQLVPGITLTNVYGKGFLLQVAESRAGEAEPGS